LSSDDTSDDSDDPDYCTSETARHGQYAPPNLRVEDSRPVQGSPNPPPPQQSQISVAPSSSNVLPPRRVPDKGKGIVAPVVAAEIIELSDSEDEPAATSIPATEPVSITPAPSFFSDECIALTLKKLRARLDGGDASSSDLDPNLNKCLVSEVMF
jgi:hypothetical protein